MKKSLHRRDGLVAVARFKQLSTLQLWAIAYPNAKSRTTTDRVLSYLTTAGLLVPVERERLVGGAQSGSGQWLYRLSADAWRTYRTDKYKGKTKTDYHALEVASTYIRVLEAEKQKWLRLHYSEIEYETLRKVEGASIRSDMYLELDHIRLNKRLRYAIEVDKGTEGRTDIQEKVRSYIHARTHDRYVYKVFPRVLFLTDNPRRVENLRRWIGETYRGDEQLFTVELLENFPSMLR